MYFIFPKILLNALINETPPPGTIPSANAAFVANNASSTLSFFSLISISLFPPTETIATPPINLTVSGSQEVTIWHPVPNTPTDYGEPGWMAYDGDYHYIYAGGRWLRQSIADWTV